MKTDAEKAARFRALHERPGAFVIPNPWDAGTARLLASLGFEALATTSLGLANSLGRVDGTNAVSRAEVIENCRVIAAATDLPVNADLENGYADEPRAAAEMIRLAAGAGISGGSIEDATGDPARPIYDFDLAVERVHAAVEVARALPVPFLLTARAENLLFGRDLDDAIRRLQAFERVGADVLYAPGVRDLPAIRAVVSAVGKPVNVVMSAADPDLTVAQLVEAGVKRISVGGALSRLALAAFLRGRAGDGRPGRVHLDARHGALPGSQGGVQGVPMTITVTRLTPCFAARVFGADIARPLDDATWAAIRAAFEEHSVLLFRGQPLDDEAQIAFSRRFGPLEVTRSMNPAAGTPFARQSNLDIKTGEVIPPDDRRMVYQLANMLWHSDSSFKPVPSLCSLLSGRIVPPEGGATELASARAAFPSLPEALRSRVESAVAVHDFSWSRDQVRPGFFTAEERAVYPPVRHPLVRVNPVNRQPALFLGAHASHVDGLPIPEGRALLRALLDHVTQPRFVYRHEWEAGDLIVWDNRCVLHRATPYDTTNHKRLMQRTTVSGDPAGR